MLYKLQVFRYEIRAPRVVLIVGFVPDPRTTSLSGQGMRAPHFWRPILSTETRALSLSHACTHTRTHTHTHTHTHTRTRTHTLAHTHMHTHTQTHMHT